MKRSSARWIVAIALGALAVAPMLADNSFTIALTGDSLITMKLSVHTDPPFLKMIDQSRAGVSWGDTRARPGLNPLRFTTTQIVTREQFDALRGALTSAGIGTGRGQNGEDGRQRAADGSATAMTLANRRIVAGEKTGTHTEPLKEDVDAMAAVVRNAHKVADYTIVNSHTHEAGAERYYPPEFFITFAHAMIDAGADVVSASGPHVLRGIEIYKGKPVMYGLGNFIFENETLLRQPPENYAPLGMTLESGAGVGDFNERRSNNDTIGFPADERIWESVIAVPRFVGRQLAEVKLYPITRGYKKPRPQRGWPMLAGPELSRKIIDDVARFSTPFGTKIEFRDGAGAVVPGATHSEQ